jgi:hypothetical protein
MLYRMLKTYLVSVQANSAVRIGTGSAVFKVALDGAAKMRKLAADLVVTACKKFYLNQVI